MPIQVPRVVHQDAVDDGVVGAIMDLRLEHLGIGEGNFAGHGRELRRFILERRPQQRRIFMVDRFVVASDKGQLFFDLQPVEREVVGHLLQVASSLQQYAGCCRCHGARGGFPMLSKLANPVRSRPVLNPRGNFAGNRKLRTAQAGVDPLLDTEMQDPAREQELQQAVLRSAERIKTGDPVVPITIPHSQRAIFEIRVGQQSLQLAVADALLGEIELVRTLDQL